MENQVICSCCYKPLHNRIDQYGTSKVPVCFDCFMLGVSVRDQMTELNNGDRVLYVDDVCIELHRPYDYELPIFHQKQILGMTHHEMPILVTRSMSKRNRVKVKKEKRNAHQAPKRKKLMV